MAEGGAQAAVEGFSVVLNRIDAQRRLSVTYDQGREMSQHEKLSKRTGVKVYFAEPHSPWQRGINESTNGLLRQYLTKGIDLSVFSQNELDTLAWALNTRPQKVLALNALQNYFYLILLMKVSITFGLLHFVLETALSISFMKCSGCGIIPKTHPPTSRQGSIQKAIRSI